jgi:hypothetical protein
MDKIVSARLEETAINEMERVTRQLGITKKRFLEEAIRCHARELTARREVDDWSETCGAWRRKESVPATVNRARGAFRRSFRRH